MSRANLLWYTTTHASTYFYTFRIDDNEAEKKLMTPREIEKNVCAIDFSIEG